MKLFVAILAAGALCGLQSCQETAVAGTQGQIQNTPAGPVDTRISPHGARRPSLPATITDDRVTYDNPRTGTHSDYSSLDVDRDSDGKPIRINWPSGGWSEIHEYQLSDEGDHWLYRNDHGYEYRIPK